MQIPAPGTLQIRKLRDYIGVEAAGVDLASPIDAQTRQRLTDALVRNVVMVIKNQAFDARQFLAAGSVFGEPLAHRYSTRLADVPLVHRISSHDRNEDGSVRHTGPDWHTDHADDECPPKFTALYAVELFRTGGGSTGFVNMCAAYDALPESLKQRIAPLKAIYMLRKRRLRAGADGADPSRATGPVRVIHPLVRTHPDTGRRALYFHRQRIEAIVGMSAGETSALLSELLERALQPAFMYSHNWTLGDMLIWDNRSVLHRANPDYDPTDLTQHRCMLRMLVKGESPS